VRLDWTGEWDDDPNDVFLSVGAASRLAGVSVDTIRRWCANGRLAYRQGGPNNHRRIRRSDLLQLISGQATEPPVRARGGRRRLPELLDDWDDELDALLPWRLGVTDTPDRITRMLVTLRGYSTGTSGGLIARLQELVADMEAAVGEFDERHEPEATRSRSSTDLDDDPPGYLAVAERARRLEEFVADDDPLRP
jgi:excisionase family DNA binding protein